MPPAGPFETHPRRPVGQAKTPGEGYPRFMVSSLLLLASVTSVSWAGPTGGDAAAPPGLSTVPVADIVAGPLPPELEGCTAAMGQVGRGISRWAGCGGRTVSVLGSLPLVEVDVEALLRDVPASASAGLGEPVRGEPTAMRHAGQTLSALRLTRVADGVVHPVGVAVAWPGGVQRELAICIDPDGTAWCETVLRALLTPPRREGASPPRETLPMLMEPAPEGAHAPNRLLTPAAAPDHQRLVGCARYAGMKDPAIARMDCTQGRVVAEPLDGAFDLDRARETILPYLLIQGENIRSAGAAQTLMIGGRPVEAAPLVGDGVSGFVIRDPTAPSPRAIGCLDRAPGLGQTPWCAVALESMWGTAAGEPPNRAH